MRAGALVLLAAGLGAAGWRPPATAEEVALPEVWTGRQRWHQAHSQLRQITLNTTMRPSNSKTERACARAHHEWRKKLVRAVRGGLARAEFRNVNGSGRVRLPVEPLHPFHPLPPLPRAFVDPACWEAPRWLFVDLGARFFMRIKTKRGKHLLQFGSFFEGLCGLPGGERFAFHSFDINDYGRGNVPPFVKWHHAAVGVAGGWVTVAGQDAGAHAQAVPAGQPPPPGAVPSIDFPAWLLDHARAADFVVVKMDIEGAEFAVIRALIASGAHRLIDELYFECHGVIDRDVRLAWRLHTMPGGERVPDRNVRPLDCAYAANDLRAAGVYTHDWD
eukprot:TRINITY_DN66374_c0_g1_i1.p1 TRINITY_DN66374_c0_g1~~TRINITY_DN66374_c0_g1_i1.p1  ORF type:complete len:332 (+),score=66.56 TRINITY_DN66374_c0_g1_i1:80-1075(+)